MKNNINPWDENAPYRQNELENHGDKTYWEVLVPLFTDEIKKLAANKEVIDVGCGLGFLTNEIAPHVREITGIDTSPKSIKYAQDHFTGKNIKFINTSIIDFQRKRQNNHNDKCHYDICIANMVFHNIPDLDECLFTIHKLLKKDGLLIYATPHPAFWYATRNFFKPESYIYHKEKEYEVPFQIKNFPPHPYPIAYWHRSLERYTELLKKNKFIILDEREPCHASYLQKEDHVFKDILFRNCKAI